MAVSASGKPETAFARLYFHPGRDHAAFGADTQGEVGLGNRFQRTIAQEPEVWWHDQFGAVADQAFGRGIHGLRHQRVECRKGQHGRQHVLQVAPVLAEIDCGCEAVGAQLVAPLRNGGEQQFAAGGICPFRAGL